MRKNYLWFIPMWVLAFLAPDIRAQQVVADYNFSGNAKDASATGNHAAIHGALLTQDRFGVANKAFVFSGDRNWLSAPNNDALQSPETTVSFWVRVDELPAQGEVFILSHGGWQERWKISLPAHGKPVWTTNHSGGISDMDSGDGNALAIGQWTHVVMVHDGVQDLIYFNGNLVAQKNVAGTLNSTQYPLGMGYDPIGGGLFFTGALDDILIYDGALDAGEIATLYFGQAISPVFPDGETARYPMNGNLNDESGYGNHAKGTDTDFIPDRFGFGGQAVSFNGISSEVTAANSAQLNSPWTSVSFWVNVTELPASGETFIASFGGWQERWKISLPAHGKLVWTTNHENGISDMDAGDGHELVPGTWTHVVCVHSTMKDLIYINGDLAAEKDVVGAFNNTTYPLGLGYNVVDGGNYFHGALDEFTIFNNPLSAQAVSDLYTEQSTRVIDPDPLVANFPFSGDALDASQFKNDGIVNGAGLDYDRHGYASSAMYLDGESSIDVANSVQYNSDYTTVGFWVNMDELPGSGEVYLMSFGGWQERWKISLPSHGKPVWTTNHSGGISDMDSGDGNALVPGQWMHVVASHGPVSDKIYINGALAAEKAVGGTLNATSYPLGIGYNAVDGGNYMSGAIDEVRIYNRDLTDEEVLNWYTEQNTEPVITDEVVADYPFEGNAKDVSAFHNHGVNEGATSGKDRFGRSNHSMTFNGASSNVSAPNSPQLNSPLATVSFWVNVNNLPGNGESYLLSLGGWQERWKISLPTHGKPVWTTNHTGGISDMDSGDGHELQVGEWTHLVMVHDGDKDLIYMNGTLVAEKSVVGLLNNTTHPLGIGYNIVDGGSYFDGSLDDILLFNVALSAAEVEALYDEQAADPMETDIVPPDAPIDLKATVNFTNVSLFWCLSSDDDSGVSGYNVYQNGSIIQTVTMTEAHILGLAPITLYEFGVSAVDFAGNESTISTISVLTGMDENPDITPPTMPTNLAVTAGSNSAVFSWDASIDDTGIAGYVVFVDGNLIDTVAGNQTSIFIGGLEPSTPYAFEVYAFDFAGNDSEIAFVVASTTDPIDTGEPGLVAHYKFEDDANDSTPYNNHGTIGGNPVFIDVAGHPGSNRAIVMDGQQDSVFVPNAVQLISDYATVSFWIRVDNINLMDPECYVLDFGHWDQRWKISLPQHLKIVWTTNGNNLQFSNFISDMDSGDGNELVLGFWWYVTMVHDGTNDIIYLDGIEVNRKAVNTKLNSTARPFVMGSDPVDGGRYFPGALDEVKLYNKALTAEEILKLYTTGTTGIKDLQDEIQKYVEILYPNPTKDALTIKHGFGARHDLLVRIFDQQGRQVGAERFTAQDMDYGLLSLNVAGLHSGMYNLNFVLGGKVLGSVPFIKQ